MRRGDLRQHLQCITCLVELTSIETAAAPLSSMMADMHGAVVPELTCMLRTTAQGSVRGQQGCIFTDNPGYLACVVTHWVTLPWNAPAL
jgi:hypothetical protein